MKELLDDELMTTEQVSEYTKIAVSTLQMYRTYGTGPKFVKVRKRLVRYRKYEVDEWINEMQRQQTEQTFMQKLNRNAKQWEREINKQFN